jgi:hypothetical protein
MTDLDKLKDELREAGFNLDRLNNGCERVGVE